MHLENPEAIKLPEFCVVDFVTIETIEDFLAANTIAYDAVNTYSHRSDLAFHPSNYYEDITYTIPGHEAIIYTEGLIDCTGLVTLNENSAAICHSVLNVNLKMDEPVNHYQLRRLQSFVNFQRRLQNRSNIISGTNVPIRTRQRIKNFLSGKVEGDIDTDFTTIFTDPTKLSRSGNYTQDVIHGIYIIPPQLSVSGKMHLTFTTNDYTLYFADEIEQLAGRLDRRNKRYY